MPPDRRPSPLCQWIGRTWRRPRAAWPPCLTHRSQHPWSAFYRASVAASPLPAACRRPRLPRLRQCEAPVAGGAMGDDGVLTAAEIQQSVRMAPGSTVVGTSLSPPPPPPHPTRVISPPAHPSASSSTLLEALRVAPLMNAKPHVDGGPRPIPAHPPRARHSPERAPVLAARSCFTAPHPRAYRPNSRACAFLCRVSPSFGPFRAFLHRFSS
jgi:hypothetical protein